MVKNVLHRDGSEWFDNCQSCQCHKGVVTCEIESCDCSKLNPSSQEVHQCCPQCSQTYEEPHKCLLLDQKGIPLNEYHHGQKWLSQCQECECMVCI